MKTLILISAAFLASINTTKLYAQTKVKTTYNLDVVSNIMEDSLELLFHHSMSKSSKHVQEVVNYITTGEHGIIVSNYTKISLDDLNLEEVSPKSIVNGLLDVIQSENKLLVLNPDLFNVVYVEFNAKNYLVVSLENSDKISAGEIDKINAVSNFNQALFESALITEMEQQFPMLKMDTSLLFVVRATSQKDAGNPECYVMKKGGMVNLQENELTQAHRIVKEYKRHMSEDRNFDSTTLIRCNFTEFCVTTVLQYGGLIRYGIVIDNNFKREDAIFDTKKFESELKNLNLIIEDER